MITIWDIYTKVFLFSHKTNEVMKSAGNGENYKALSGVTQTWEDFKPNLLSLIINYQLSFMCPFYSV